MPDISLSALHKLSLFIYLFVCLFICLFIYLLSFCLFRAAPMAYGSSWARCQIIAVAAGLCQSHSNARSEMHLKPTPQRMAMLDL